MNVNSASNKSINERQEKKMSTTIFEETGGTYIPCGDYLLPNLALPPEETASSDIGAWGRKHLAYIRQHKPILYTNLLTGGKLSSYLANIDRRASEMHLRAVITILAEKEGVTEQLKAENQMLWVQKMNAIGNAVTEMVNAEMIYN